MTETVHPTPDELATMRAETLGVLNFEPTDENLRRVWLDNPHLVAQAQEWGWGDTDVRDQLCAALERPRNDTTTTGRAVTRTAVSGEPIRADEVYAVTPDGQWNINWRMDYLFIQPDHLWRANWLPEAAGCVSLIRDDNTNLSHHWASAAGLLGVCAHPVRGQFRMVRMEELRAATATIVEQMDRWVPETIATVAVPTGFTIHIVRPELVHGTIRAHRRAALGLDSDPALASYADYHADYGLTGPFLPEQDGTGDATP